MQDNKTTIIGLLTKEGTFTPKGQTQPINFSKTTIYTATQFASNGIGSFTDNIKVSTKMLTEVANMYGLTFNDLIGKHIQFEFNKYGNVVKITLE